MGMGNANFWELYRGKTSLDKIRKKRWEKIRKDTHNKRVIECAKEYARSMRIEPSELEKKMQTFLDNQHIHYEFQKPLLIKDSNGYIRRFYIADFFIPKINTIIETDGKFHDDQVILDSIRTRDIQENYGDYQVIRWRWHDFQSLKKMHDLLETLKGK